MAAATHTWVAARRLAPLPDASLTAGPRLAAASRPRPGVLMITSCSQLCDLCRPLQDPRAHHTGGRRAGRGLRCLGCSTCLAGRPWCPAAALWWLGTTLPLGPVPLFTHCLPGDLPPWLHEQGVLPENGLLINILAVFSAAVCSAFPLLGCPGPRHLFNVSSH